MSAYEDARQLALEIRNHYGFSTARVMKADLRRIYKDRGIKIDYWDRKLKHLRGVYVPPPLGPSVLIAKRLPEEPQIFTLAHELKHDLTDRLSAGSFCDPSNENVLMEKVAEAFAAELIFPSQMFDDLMQSAGVDRGNCTADDLVHLKRSSRTTMSYAALCKIAERLNYCNRGAFAKIHFRNREEELYGVPLYKRIRGNRRKL